MPRQPALICIAAVAAVLIAGCGGDEPVADTPPVEEPSPTGTPTADGDDAAKKKSKKDKKKSKKDKPLDNWVEVTDKPSGAQFLLPEEAEPQSNTAQVEGGGEVALRNYSATTEDGIDLGFNIIDMSGDSYDLDAGVTGVADTLGGEVVSSEDTEVSGQAAVDVELSYGDDMVVLFTLISTEDYVMQTLASGAESERSAVEATYQQLTGSLEVR